MKTPKILLPLCLFFGLTFFSCVKEQDLTLIDEVKFEDNMINAIEASDAWSITVIADTTRSRVELKYSAYLQDKVTAVLENGKLKLGIKGVFNWVSGTKYEAVVYLSSLQDLELSDATRVVMQGSFDANSFTFVLKDASTCVGGTFLGSKCSVDLSDGSNMADFSFDGNEFSATIDDASRFVGNANAANSFNVNLRDASNFVNYSGTSQYASIDLDDASTLNMIQTEVVEMEVSLRSASSATVFVTNAIRGSLKGASTLYYSADPELDVDCSDGSSVVPL